MPYKDTEQRKQAARKWRLRHRAERAAYMRRYRKARSSGRARGRPRTAELSRPGALLEVQTLAPSQLTGAEPTDDLQSPAESPTPMFGDERSSGNSDGGGIPDPTGQRSGSPYEAATVGFSG
jgi:hypothetical protein